jgi:hypothetical protein
MHPTKFQDVTFLTGPERLSYRLLNLSSTDKGAFLVLIALGSYLWGKLGFFGLAAGILLTTYFLWPLAWSRRYYAWGEKVYDAWIKLVDQATLWESDEVRRESHRVWWRRLLRALIMRAHPFPLRVDTLFDYGLIHNVRSGTDSLVITGDGSRIAAMDPDEQSDHQEIIADEIRRIAGYKGITATVSMVLRRRPSNPVLFDQNQDRHAFPDHVMPEALVAMARTNKSADELYADGEITREQLRDYRLHRINVAQNRASYETDGSSVDMAMVITIKRSARLIRADKRKHGKPLEAAEVRRERLVQLAESMGDALVRASVANPHVLNAEECADYLRSAWDVADLSDYYRARLRPQDNATSDAVSLYQPQHAIYAKNGVCVMDRTGHAVVRITKLPKQIPPNMMPRLFTDSGVRWVTRTMVGETTTGNSEYYGFTWLGFILEDILDALGLHRTGRKTQRRKETLDSNASQIDEQAHIEYFNGYLATAGVDEVQLNLDVEELIRTVANIGGQAQRVPGGSRQARATLTAVTGIPLL